MKLKKIHGLALVALIAVVAIVLVAAGVFVGRHIPYKTLPAPPVPKGQVNPGCGTDATGKVTENTDHVKGQCLPYPKTAPPPGVQKHASLDYTLAAFTSGITGPDLSNNDPVYSAAGWDAIKAHSKFVYLKSVEGTGFYDGTAKYMTAAAKARGIPVGGYDFQHVCGNSAVAEATFFVKSLYAQGLLGKGTLPPAADSEYGNGACGGRGWLQTWVNTVYNLDGHVCPITYTGAWWWQPNVGSFWPTCNNVQLKTWISGYGVSYPYMPSGVSHLDFWQFTDHGFNGANSGDLSAWQHSATEFVTFSNAGPPPPPPDKYGILDKTRRDLGHGIKAAEYWTVKTWDRNGCKHPAKRVICRSSRDHARLLAYRIDTVACRKPHPVATGAICDYRPNHWQARRAWLGRVGAA